MDDYEKRIHKALNLTSYKRLKEEGFYKKISPLSNFHAEYLNQYLQLTAYYKLYFAYQKLDFLKNKNYLYWDYVEASLDKIDNIDNFISNIFSVCDILSKQIFIVLTDSVEGIEYIYLHRIASEAARKKLNNNKIDLDKFNKYFSNILEPTTLDNSWYHNLKNYRNQISHGILIFKYKLLSDDARLLKIDIYDKSEKFEALIKDEPVHNKNLEKNEIEEFLEKLKKNYYSDKSISEQFTEYFEEVKKLASDVWEKMHELYRDEGVQVDWKLG